MSVLDTIELVMANFASLDATGQWLARVDNLGFGPIQTPSRVMWNGPRARLLAYDGRGTGAALLIVPAPIKRGYIWDLLPDVSVVQRCLAAGLLVYLLEWTDPDEGDAGLGLHEHIENVISPAIDAVLQVAGRRQTFLAGHSLGGTLAAIASAIQPDRVGGLIFIEAPLHFGPEAGALAPMFEMTMRWPAAGFGQRLIPGSFLTLSAVLASPDAFLVAPWFDWLSSTGSHAAVVHLCVQKWVEDELAMPGQLAIDIGDQLYRDDRFAVGTLTIGGKPISPDPLSRIPTLASSNLAAASCRAVLRSAYSQPCPSVPCTSSGIAKRSVCRWAAGPPSPLAEDTRLDDHAE